MDFPQIVYLAGACLSNKQTDRTNKSRLKYQPSAYRYLPEVPTHYLLSKLYSSVADPDLKDPKL
jgi:hypothetical protein